MSNILVCALIRFEMTLAYQFLEVYDQEDIWIPDDDIEDDESFSLSEDSSPEEIDYTSYVIPYFAGSLNLDDENKDSNSLVQQREERLSRLLKSYRMKLVKMQGIVEKLKKSYFFTRELEAYEFDIDKKYERNLAKKRIALQDKVKKIKAQEQKNRERLENEKKRRATKEAKRSSSVALEGSDEIAEKPKRKRATKKEETPKQTTKPVAYKPKPLEPCKYEGCDESALPLTPYCYCHILSDENQLLFVKCRYESPTGKACNYPVLRYCEPPICTGHIDLANKSDTTSLDGQKKKKEKATDDKRRKQDKKEKPQFSSYGNGSAEEIDSMQNHQSMFVIHNENPTQPPQSFPYMVHPPHPMMPFNGMVPNGQGNFIHYNAPPPPNPNNVNFFNFLPHQ